MKDSSVLRRAATVLAVVVAAAALAAAPAGAARPKPPRAPKPPRGSQPQPQPPQRSTPLSNTCSWVPLAPGLDQSPSKPEEYGKCTSQVDQHIVGPSNWCQFGKLGMCE